MAGDIDNNSGIDVDVRDREGSSTADCTIVISLFYESDQPRLSCRYFLGRAGGIQSTDYSGSGGLEIT